MAGTGTSPLDRLRRPEYTGENRCVPCTIVNLLLTGLLGGAVAVVSVPLAALVVAASLLAIYLRGYLVPGTPTLTKRFLPTRVLRLFDKHPAEEQSDDYEFDTLEKLEAERRNAVDPERFLRETGAIEPTEEGDEYRFTPDFRTAVASHVESAERAGASHTAVPDIFGVDAGEAEVLDREYPAVEVGIRVRKWPSDAALIADVAAHLALDERTDDWGDVPSEQRVSILETLRAFHETCPDCGGPVEYSEDVVDSCCGQHQVKSFACLDCGQHLLEFDQERVGPNVKGMTP